MSFLFQNLRVYQESVSFSQAIFELTRNWPVMYRFSLTDQLIRASLSISLNIAEGSSRTAKDYQHFLRIAKGSCFECIPLLSIAKNLTLITNEEYERFFDILDHIAKMISLLSRTIASNHDKRFTIND